MTFLLRLSLSAEVGDEFPCQEALDCSSKILLSNPDISTAWRLRRFALVRLLSLDKAALPADTPFASDAVAKDHDSRVLMDGTSFEANEKTLRHQLVMDEMEFSKGTIKVNPKSYGSWLHRKWMSVALGLDPVKELVLCAKLLELDARNFHCWNYRIHLFDHHRLLSTPEAVQAEVDFTTLMIYKNFSNYSAWHRRAVVLPLLGDPKLAEQIVADLRLVRSAYYTEPSDQSCWFYLSWLLGTFVVSNRERLASLDVTRLIEEEIGSIRELLSVEPSCSLAVFTLRKLGEHSQAFDEDGPDYALRSGMYNELL